MGITLFEKKPVGLISLKASNLRKNIYLYLCAETNNAILKIYSI